MTEHPELTEVKHIGESRAKEFRELGYDTPASIAVEDVNVLAGKFNSIGQKQMTNIKKDARALLERRWERVKYDERNHTYYDAGPKVWHCGCGNVFKDKAEWEIHDRRCDMTDVKPIKLNLPRDLQVDSEEAKQVLLRYFEDGETFIKDVIPDDKEWGIEEVEEYIEEQEA